MDESNLEKLARVSGRGFSKALDALTRNGLDLRKMLDKPISRVPRRDTPAQKAEE
jgi:hypothetical protein